MAIHITESVEHLLNYITARKDKEATPFVREDGDMSLQFDQIIIKRSEDEGDKADVEFWYKGDHISTTTTQWPMPGDSLCLDGISGSMKVVVEHE